MYCCGLYFYSDFFIEPFAKCILLLLDISKEALIYAFFYAERLFVDKYNDFFHP